MKAIFNKTYHLPTRSFLINSTAFYEGSHVFKDWEDFGPQNLPEYFNKGFEIFSQKLQEFKNLEKPLSMKDQQELNFMLEALIHAKNTLYEDFKN